MQDINFKILIYSFLNYIYNFLHFFSSIFPFLSLSFFHIIFFFSFSILSL